MPSSPSDIDELKTLQHEMEHLRAKRSERVSEAEPDSEAPPWTEPDSEAPLEMSEIQQKLESLQDLLGKKQFPEWDKTIQDLMAHFEQVVTEVGETTRERPLLSLTAAFTGGIVVGYLLSRRSS